MSTRWRECQTDMYDRIENIIHIYFSYIYREYQTCIYLHDRKRISYIYIRQNREYKTYIFLIYICREYKTHIYMQDRKRISDIYTRCMVCECDVSYAKRI